jgi:DNA-binding SARP family transcriptional activator
MALTELVTASIETLNAHYKQNKLLLIHPSSRFHNLLIASLLNDSPAPLYYYGLGIEDVNLSQFLTGIMHDLADQAGAFGRHLGDALNRTPQDIAALAQAFANDLAELSDKDYLLILDEYDRGDEVAELQTLIEQLLEYLPKQCHLLINSRTLPRLPWVALVAKRQAAVLRDSYMLPTGFYSEQYSENPNVEVYALGPGYVMVNGQHVGTWEGHLPKLLFFFVLDRPMATRSDICHAFWPELSVEQAVNVFHVTKRRLHKALGFDVLLHEGGHYRVNPALNLQYDVLEFVSSLVEGRAREGENGESHWQHAIDMYRGNYLQGHDDPWVATRRADFREGYLEALTQLAALREGEGKPDQALGLYQRALNEAYNREDLHREIIRLYGRLGRRSEAVEHYRRLETDLSERFGIKPSPETKALFEEVVEVQR